MRLLSFVIPTRDRPDELCQTIRRLNAYPRPLLGEDPPEVIVVDNASHLPVEQVLQEDSATGLPIRVIRLNENKGAAARNLGVAKARSPWVVMLDDDSAPTAGEIARLLRSLPADVAALGAQITLPCGRRESGGLPEVVIGCGCAVRRGAFLEVGGYDVSFDYYAEEYDLCAKLIAAGYRVGHSVAWSVEHRKTANGRDFSRILYRLVRNNAWVISRYAPAKERDAALHKMLLRYERIARLEGVADAYARARSAIDATIAQQPYTPLNELQWQRFIGMDGVRQALVPVLRSRGIDAVSIVAPGKGCDIIETQLLRAGIAIDDSSKHQVIGVLSPGPMLDAAAAYPDAYLPWHVPSIISTELVPESSDHLGCFSRAASHNPQRQR